VTPGPGVLSTAGIGAAYGFRAGLRYVTGLFIGTNLVALAVITGLAAILLSVPVIRLVLTLASIAYLIYLAARIAFAGSKLAFIEAKAPPAILSGVALQAINPKAYAVNTTLFAGFPFAPENLAFETAAKLLIVNAIWIPIHLGWLYAGAALHRMDLPERTHKRINYAMAGSMLLVVALALYASLFNG
jgi:threonine/homoserine/homoserine lactone efflux protein